MAHRLGFVLACMLGAAAAHAEVVYTPSDEKIARTTELQAAQAVVEIAQRTGFRGMVVFGPEIRAFMAPAWVTSVTVESDRLIVVHEKGRIETRFSDLPAIEV